MKNNSKKVSYLSIIVIIIGGTIGAGIFFKNQTLSQLAQGKFGIVLATWGVGILGMISLALALVEVSSAQKTNKGSLEWAKLFTPRWFYKTSSNYFKWIYVPLSYFALPLYVASSLEDSGMNMHSGSLVLLLSLAIFIWFMITNLISLKFAEVSQWVFTALQTIPLVILPIIGMLNWGNDLPQGGTILDKNLEPRSGFVGFSPWLATIAGISAISFAYDGFYQAASLRNEMKEPEKIGKSLVWGLIVVSVVYLFLTIGFNVAGDGTHFGLEKTINNEKVFKFFNACIAIGIMAIINTFAMTSPRQFSDMIISGDAKEIVWLQKKIFKNKYNHEDAFQRYKMAWIWTALTGFLTFAILGPVGAYGYTIDNSYGDVYVGSNLYAFADALTNFTSLWMFVIISTSVLGALINRKTNKVIVKKKKYFIPFAIIAISVNYIGVIYMILETIIDISGINGGLWLNNTIKLAIFVSSLIICVLPVLISSKKRKISENIFEL